VTLRDLVTILHYWQSIHKRENMTGGIGLPSAGTRDTRHCASSLIRSLH